jgi:hypothetical protein
MSLLKGIKSIVADTYFYTQGTFGLVIVHKGFLRDQGLIYMIKCILYNYFVTTMREKWRKKRMRRLRRKRRQNRK